MLKQTTIYGKASLVALALLATTSLRGHAGEVVLYNAEMPSAAEIADVMFPKAGKPTYGKTRGIRFTTEDAAPAAPRPSPSLMTAAVEPAEAPVAQPEPRRQAEPVAQDEPEGSAVGFNIRFALDSADILPDAKPYLDKVGEALKSEAKDGKVVIVGHTDARGTAEYNRSLSERRALAVQAYLVDHWQVSAERLQVMGEGKDQPLPGLDPMNGANRRVEFHPAG